MLGLTANLNITNSKGIKSDDDKTVDNYLIFQLSTFYCSAAYFKKIFVKLGG
jgi:hypothetical protein